VSCPGSETTGALCIDCAATVRSMTNDHPIRGAAAAMLSLVVLVAAACGGHSVAVVNAYTADVTVEFILPDSEPQFAVPEGKTLFTLSNYGNIPGGKIRVYDPACVVLGQSDFGEIGYLVVIVRPDGTLLTVEGRVVSEGPNEYAEWTEQGPCPAP
jgi:hypothetical protein